MAVGKHNPCGLFATVYIRNLWRNITHKEEDSAQAKLKRLDFGEESVLLKDKQVVTVNGVAVAA